ncbi:carboxypeptidase regulatory-like domain-containing protein [Hymenobacter sp. CRA2]|uniref:carboxypeptidase regulatory-like domain-containing protein n=1 Tax=Hymenobacter sp. CRA2 TaxID=1955620 RepID=UPI00098F8A1C|nr:carboxypeptidase regulatory-like domain-containing protein [Hymenobacter sp. CRA2]OON70273.1 hypothetical protein B0919_05955 [Hymenobacter sp. CRA2]
MKTLAAFRFFLSALALVAVAKYAPAAAPATASTGQLSGALLDGTSHEPIPQANVVLLRAADGAYVATATTRPDGTFEFRGVPFGQYRLHPTVLGYQGLRPVYGLNARQPRLTLGSVALTPLGAKLAGTLVCTPQLYVASTTTKVGHAGRYVLTTFCRQRRAAGLAVRS